MRITCGTEGTPSLFRPPIPFTGIQLALRVEIHAFNSANEKRTTKNDRPSDEFWLSSLDRLCCQLHLLTFATGEH
jgi:hypothetical protein